LPQIRFTAQALLGLQRCRQFLEGKNPAAAARAGRAIGEQIILLETAPEIGRPVPSSPTRRELVIPFADSGYVALYEWVLRDDSIYILAIRHQKEAGF
jgi:plasmid stabilization system protein ParE